MLGDEVRCRGARRVQGGEQSFRFGERSVRGELDVPRQLPACVLETGVGFTEPHLGVGGLAPGALALGVERGDRVDGFARGRVGRLRDLLGVEQSRPIGGFPVGGQIASADRTGVAGVKAVGSGGRRFRPPRRGQVVVGAGRLSGRGAFRLLRGLEAPREVGLFGPERVEPLAGLVGLGRPLGTPGVLLRDRVPPFARGGGRLVEGGALRRVPGRPLLRVGGGRRQAPGLGVLVEGGGAAGAEGGGPFFGRRREGAEALQRRQGRRGFLARGAVVGGDAGQRFRGLGLAPFERRVLFRDSAVDVGQRSQGVGGPAALGVAQALDGGGRRLPGLVGREHRLAGGGRGPFVFGRGGLVAARGLVRCLQPGQMRGRVLGMVRRRLLQPDPQLLGFLAGRPGQLSRRLELVGAPDLPQDPAPVGRLVLHQQSRETALGQDDGAQERLAVEPQQRLDALVDGLDLLDLLDRLVVGADAAKLRAGRPDPALSAAAQGAGDLPRLAGHPEPEHDAEVHGRVVHQLLVRLSGERRLPVQGVGDRLEDGGLAGPGVADDGEVVAAGEVEDHRRPERAQPFDGEADGAHVSSVRRSVSRRGGRAPLARAGRAASARSRPGPPGRRCRGPGRRARRPRRGAP